MYATNQKLQSLLKNLHRLGSVSINSDAIYPSTNADATLNMIAQSIPETETTSETINKLTLKKKYNLQHRPLGGKS